MQYFCVAPSLKSLAIVGLAIFPFCSLALGSGGSSNKAVTQEMRDTQIKELHTLLD